ncbi:uncharacterized protein LOC119402905 [Rhipicephalus sanguineus]|uniref:uncharacterized protein LOC119402905 n=1 Tax=Rhipicephalus sanguineus TaxID=34632 RepID=UPI0020C58C62|nr:uncharacterized protein LOC119402905 [Rhipicephalus sanguineus]
MDLINSAKLVKTDTIKLSHCTKGNLNLTLPTTLLGQCSTDLGTSCKKSATSFVSPLVSLVKCLVGNALPSAPQEKVIALVCDLANSTKTKSFERLPLWLGVYDIQRKLCKACTKQLLQQQQQQQLSLTNTTIYELVPSCSSVSQDSGFNISTRTTGPEIQLEPTHTPTAVAAMASEKLRQADEGTAQITAQMWNLLNYLTQIPA